MTDRRTLLTQQLALAQTQLDMIEAKLNALPPSASPGLRRALETERDLARSRVAAVMRTLEPGGYRPGAGAGYRT